MDAPPQLCLKNNTSATRPIGCSHYYCKRVVTKLPVPDPSLLAYCKIMIREILNCLVCIHNVIFKYKWVTAFDTAVCIRGIYIVQWLLSVMNLCELR